MKPLARWQVLMAVRGLPGVEKSVLGAYAFHANEETLEAWPSLETLAAETGFCRTAVWRAVRSLEAVGALTAVEKSEGRHSSRYRVNIDEPAAWRTVEPAAMRTVAGSNRTSREPLNSTPDELEQCATRTPTVRQTHPNKERTRIEQPTPAALSVWDIWVSIAGEGKRSVLAKLIKEHGEDAVAAAVAAVSTKRPAEPVSYLRAILTQPSRRLNGTDRTLEGPL